MSHDDFNFEPIRGLPEALPADEHIIWQGAPDVHALAREAFKVRWVASYFAILALWRVGVSSADLPLGIAATHAVPFIVIGTLACAILYGLAYVQSRATVYTLTNKRVAMRIGASLTMTLNLPYVCIDNADLDLRKSGTGTLAFDLQGDTRLSMILTWPHTRPWHTSRTQPALRCIKDAQNVAAMFAEAAEQRLSQPIIAQTVHPDISAVAAE